MNLHNFSARHYLTPLLEPTSVAIIGASERPGSIGSVLVQNMVASGYRGNLFAVNPKHRTVNGIACHASVGELPANIDLAVVATPAPGVPEVIEECGRAGVRSAVVITAGFAETGLQGVALENQLLTSARRYGLRVLGPNCLGLMRPAIGFNATFARGGARTGSLGLISQSGAVCTALLDWAAPNGIGFSSVVSLGGSTDIDFGELIDYLVQDSATEHILLYVEGVRDARRFISALRSAARVKPVVLMKVGRYPSGSRAVMSHTGALVGADDVFDAVVRRAGVVRVQSIGQLVAAAQALASRVRPRGDRLAVITNGGGPGVMAADRATEAAVPLATLAPATIETLRSVLPSNWSHGNPLDLIGDAGADRYRAAVTACLADTGVDGALVILTPQAMTDPTEAAKAVIEVAHTSDKPLIACWMGEESVAAGRSLFAAAHIPVFRTPEPAVDMFGHISAFYRNQQTLLQTPGPLQHEVKPDVATASRIIETALAEGRTTLTQIESRALLHAFHIPVARLLSAHTADEAVLRAAEIGYPVALKIDSPDISHKSDVDGVRLNLSDATEVRAACEEMLAHVAAVKPQARVNGVNLEPMIVRKNARELMVGLIRDTVFGPVITFGAGGTAVEVLHDRALDLPPLNTALAAEMIRKTRIAKMLTAFRNLPSANVEAIRNVLLRMSEMACELPWLEELDINPLLADETGVIAVDARVAIAPRAAKVARYSHLAIHPYPSHMVSNWELSDGTVVTLRPIRPEDAHREQEFVQRLSAESRYRRFMGTILELTPQMLSRFTQIDYDREMAFVAVHEVDGREIQIGVARYITNADGESCEFAVTVTDDWQRRGIGQKLMGLLLEAAREQGLKSMVGEVLAANTQMLGLSTKLGFGIPDDDDTLDVKRVRLSLTPSHRP